MQNLSKKMIDNSERLTKEFVEYEGGIEHDGVVKGQKMTSQTQELKNKD